MKALAQSDRTLAQQLSRAFLHALLFAERLRLRIEKRLQLGPERGHHRIAWRRWLWPELQGPPSLVEAADAAMFEAKRGEETVSTAARTWTPRMSPERTSSTSLLDQVT